MEITDYLRAARSRLWILLVVPLLAGLVVAAVVVRSPTQYTAAAIVASPTIVGGASGYQYTGSQGVVQYVDAFRAAADSPQLLQKVSERTGLSTEDLEGAVSVTQVGTSSQIRITAVTGDAASATGAARETAEASLAFLFGSQLPLATKRLDEAAAEVEAAQGALAALVSRSGVAIPDRLYEIKQQQIAALQQEQLQQRAAGNAAGAAAAAETVKERRREVAELAPLVTTYRTLVNREADARAQLASSRGAVTAAKTQLEAASPSAAITLTTAAEVSLGPVLARKVGSAVASALFLSLGLVIALELRARRRRHLLPEQITDPGERYLPQAARH